MNQPIPMAIRTQGSRLGDPMLAITRLGNRAARDGIYLGFIIALLSHTAALAYPDFTTWQMAAIAENMREELHQYFWSEYDIVVEEEKEEAEAKQEEPEEVIEEPEPEEPEPVVPEPVEPPEPDEDLVDDTKDDDPYAEEEEAPAPALAPDTLTANDDAVDLSGDGWDVVDADGSQNTGTGMSSGKGKGDKIVRNRHARVGAKGRSKSTGNGKGRRKRNKKRKNMSRGLGGSFRANCPFPPQADLHQVDRAVVQLMVTVGPDGRVKKASVVSDPGYGFGRQAKRCALARTFPPALNAAGKPITQSSVMNFRFNRR